MAQVSEPGGQGAFGAPGVRALAVTVSNRAAAGVYEDRSGPVLAELLRAAGCSVVDGPLVVSDGEPVEAALRDAVDGGYDVVVTTGGTGLTPADLTPEMTRRVLDREIPGIAEALRAAGAAAGVPSAILSRGVAGTAGRTLIVNLPGSTGGVRDGMALLAPVLGHAVSQINGGDHVRAKLPAPVAPAAPVAWRYSWHPWHSWHPWRLWPGGLGRRTWPGPRGVRRDTGE
jgi:molybdenum cofactor synthesis domain-containing protein